MLNNHAGPIEKNSRKRSSRTIECAFSMLEGARPPIANIFWYCLVYDTRVPSGNRPYLLNRDLLESFVRRSR